MAEDKKLSLNSLNDRMKIVESRIEMVIEKLSGLNNGCVIGPSVGIPIPNVFTPPYPVPPVPMSPALRTYKDFQCGTSQPIIRDPIFKHIIPYPPAYTHSRNTEPTAGKLCIRVQDDGGLREMWLDLSCGGFYAPKVKSTVLSVSNNRNNGDIAVSLTGLINENKIPMVLTFIFENYPFDLLFSSDIYTPYTLFNTLELIYGARSDINTVAIVDTESEQSVRVFTDTEERADFVSTLENKLTVKLENDMSTQVHQYPNFAR